MGLGWVGLGWVREMHVFRERKRGERKGGEMRAEEAGRQVVKLTREREAEREACISGDINTLSKPFLQPTSTNTVPALREPI